MGMPAVGLQTGLDLATEMGTLGREVVNGNEQDDD